MIDFIKSWIDRYYLVHILFDGLHTNTYIRGRIGEFASIQRRKGRNIVVINAWRISRAEYLALKAIN